MTIDLSFSETDKTSQDYNFEFSDWTSSEKNFNSTNTNSYNSKIKKITEKVRSESKIEKTEKKRINYIGNIPLIPWE